MQNLKEKIESRSEKIPIAGCWIWTGPVDKDGYGKLTVNGKYAAAHRVSFEQFSRKINPQEWVLHICDTPACVNPHHLYGGSPLDNRMDALHRNRWSNKWGKRDHCSAGHKYEDGTFKLSKKDNSRICKICRKEAKQRARAKKK